jgi:hypothetical protein
MDTVEHLPHLNAHRFGSAEQVQKFIRGGRAVVTIQSERTGAHYTYRISRKEDDQPFFVGLLSGGQEFVYVGLLGEDAVRPTKKSRFTCDSQPVQALSYVMKHLNAGKMPPQTIVRHEGKCGVCNRPLTEPTSLDRGIGPDCWAKLGGDAE